MNILYLNAKLHFSIPIFQAADSYFNRQCTCHVQIIQLTDLLYDNHVFSLTIKNYISIQTRDINSNFSIFLL